MEGIILIVAIVVAFFVSKVVTQKVANRIYIVTAYNGFDTLQRGLCMSILLILVAVSLIAPDELALGLLSLVPVVILVLLNLKAKKPGYIIGLTLLQLLFAVTWFLFLLVRIVMHFVLHMNTSPLMNFDQDHKVLVKARAEQRAFEFGYTDIDAWVTSKTPYNNFEEAYRNNFFEQPGVLYNN